jgi:hypothetical protein
MAHSIALRRLTMLLALALPSSAARAQDPGDLPFAPGEVLTYSARFQAGVGGGGTFRVEAPTTLRGTTVWVLRSDMSGKLGPIKASERTASWLDPRDLTTLRYTSRQRHVLSRHDDAVDVFGSEGRWRSEKGAEGTTTNERPLDELSFLYYLRTLPLRADTAFTLARHFDTARNPTEVRVVGHEVVEVGAGRFRAVIVEMHVRDTRRYRGQGVIRIAFSDDRCRLILRLESRIPDAGAVALSLASAEGTRGDCTARLPQSPIASRGGR